MDFCHYGTAGFRRFDENWLYRFSEAPGRRAAKKKPTDEIKFTAACPDKEFRLLEKTRKFPYGVWLFLQKPVFWDCSDGKVWDKLTNYEEYRKKVLTFEKQHVIINYMLVHL